MMSCKTGPRQRPPRLALASPAETGPRQRPPRLALASPALVALGLLLSACGATEDQPVVDEPGERLVIEVAPLTIADAADVRWRLTVTNDAGQEIWQKTVTSTQYGSGDGSVSYVGPCDGDSNPNTVQLDLLALVGPDGEDLPTSSYANPTPVSRDAVCREKEDVQVSFDVTVARSANQGFFDVAIAFDDIFCSAKLDCERETGQPLELLFNDEGVRDTTVVVAFACTTGEGTATYLHMDPLRLTCSDGSEHVLDPSQGPGNIGGTAPYVFQRATYMTMEQLPGFDKCSWNTAVGIDLDAIGAGVDCTLTGLGSASASEWEVGQSPEGIWPMVDWNVTVVEDGALSCTRHPLNETGSGVETAYTDFAGHRFGSTMACTPVIGGAPSAQPNGTICDGVATGVDDRVVFADTTDGVIISVGSDSSAPMPLPTGVTLLEECCLDPCCTEP